MEVTTIIEKARAARQASQGLLAVSEERRNQALMNIADQLELRTNDIIAENQKDREQAEIAGLNAALIDRLSLDQFRIQSLADSVRSIAEQPQVVNQIVDEIKRDDGLVIQKQRVPIGVLAMIFESRPNVVIDCSALAIKSGNAIILKGGKEAHCSNLILAELVSTAVENLLPVNAIQVVTSRDDVKQLLEQVPFIDLVIPRGGESLINYVVANSKIPVLAHYKGLCHIFIDESANLSSAIDIVLNAKVQRPGVCNAVETLLLQQNLPQSFITDLFSQLHQSGVEVRVCERCPQTENTVPATEQDWSTEYLDKILSVKMVNDVKAACAHIQQYGSHHTEAILSSDQQAIDYFQQHIDASSVMINASTRFNDGGEYLLGAELGISTTKIHAYGPMGVQEMTICRHLVKGDGHIRT